MAALGRLNRSLSGRALLYMAGNLTLNFLSVLSAPLFVRLMTTEEYGLAAIYFTWVSIISNIVSLRVDGTIQNAQSEFGQKRLAGYCSSVLALVSLVAVVVIAGCALFAGVIGELGGMPSWCWVMAVATAFFLACSNVRMIYFTTARNATGNLLVSLVLAIAQIAVSLLLLTQVDIDGFAARTVGYSLPTALIGLCILAAFFMRGRVLIDRQYWRFCLTLSIPLIFSGLSYLVINQCDRLIINSLLGAASAGIYSFAYSSALPISVVSSALNTAWTPEYYEYMDKGNHAELGRHANTYMRNMTLIAMGLMLVSPEVLKLLGTKEYYDGVWLVPLVVLAYYFQFLYTWPVNCKFYFKKTKSIALATFLAAVVNVVLCLALTPPLGMVGTALASAIAFALLFLFHQVSARRGIEAYSFKMRWFLPGAVAVIVAMVATYLAMELWAVRWALAVVVGVILLREIILHKKLI